MTTHPEKSASPEEALVRLAALTSPSLASLLWKMPAAIDTVLERLQALDVGDDGPDEELAEASDTLHCFKGCCRDLRIFMGAQIYAARRTAGFAADITAEQAR